MEKIKVYYNKEMDTLDIWFGNPEDEYVCEEMGEGIILKKNKEGKVIGIEKLYLKKEMGVRNLPVEITVL